MADRFLLDPGLTDPAIIEDADSFLLLGKTAPFLTLTPTGVATAEADGVPTVNLKVAPVGVATAELEGTPKVTLNVAPVGVASKFAFGLAHIGLKVGPTGVASLFAVGVPSIKLKVATVGVPTVEAEGAPTVKLRVGGVGVPSAEAYGDPTVTFPSTLHPVITRPSLGGTERWVANITRHVFSAFTSYSVTPGDGARTIARCVWNFPDGQKKYGFVVQWTPNAACTSQNVILTIFDGLGGSNQAAYVVTVAASASFAWDKWVASTGNDTTGNGSAGLPWLTLNKAFDSWRTAGEPAWGRLEATAADAPSWTSASPQNPDFGPFYMTRSGVGANPAVVVDDNAQVQFGFSGHDSGSEGAHPCIYDGVDFGYAVPQNQAGGSHTGYFSTFHPLTTLANGIFTNGSVSFAADGCVITNSTVQFALDVGIGFSGGHSFQVVESCVSKGNGLLDSIHDGGPADHQLYATSTNHLGIQLSVFNQVSATALSGIKISGSQYVDERLNLVKNCTYGVDIGGNLGEQVQDVVVDGNVIDTAAVKGITINYCNRVSIRNVRCYGGCSDQFLFVRCYTSAETGGAAQIVQNTDLYGASVNGLTGGFVYFQDSLWQSLTIKNNAVVKSGNGVFFTVQAGADLANLTIDNNTYFRSGGTDGSSNFAVVVSGPDAGTYTFAGWKTLLALRGAPGAEAHSSYADPKFTAAKDVTLQAGSACIGGGATIGAIAWDATSAPRLAGHFDVGAIQSVGSLAPSGVPSIESYGVPSLTMKISPVGVASQFAFGLTRTKLNLVAVGVGPLFATGTPRATMKVGPAGVPSAEGYGRPAVFTFGTILPTGLDSLFVAGVPSITMRVGPHGVGSAFAPGTPSVGVKIHLFPTGVPSAEAYGIPKIRRGGKDVIRHELIGGWSVRNELRGGYSTVIHFP